MNRLALPLLLIATTVAPACSGGHAAERVAPIIIPAAAERGPNRTLSSTGRATLKIEPDIATVSIRLQVERVTTSTRAAANIRKMKQSLLSRGRALGLESKQMIASHTRIAPVYSPWQSGRVRRIVGYNATADVRAELRDFERIGPVIDAGVAAGGTTVTTAFRSTRMTEHKRQVYEMALKAARSKAEQMAAVLDIKSLRVQSVAEGQGGGGWYGWQTSQVANAMNSSPMQQGGATNNVTPDAKDLTLMISVVYEIL